MYNFLVDTLDDQYVTPVTAQSVASDIMDGDYDFTDLKADTMDHLKAESMDELLHTYINFKHDHRLTSLENNHEKMWLISDKLHQIVDAMVQLHIRAGNPL